METTSGGRIALTVKRVGFNTSVGAIQGSTTRTVELKLKPKRPGKVKLTFKATSKDAGGKTAKKITAKK